MPHPNPNIDAVKAIPPALNTALRGLLTDGLPNFDVLQGYSEQEPSPGEVQAILVPRMVKATSRELMANIRIEVAYNTYSEATEGSLEAATALLWCITCLMNKANTALAQVLSNNCRPLSAIDIPEETLEIKYNTPTNTPNTGSQVGTHWITYLTSNDLMIKTSIPLACISN